MILNWTFITAFLMLMGSEVAQCVAMVLAVFARFVRLKGLTNKKEIKVVPSLAE